MAFVKQDGALRVVYKKNGRFYLDAPKLQEIIEEVKDLEIAIISIAGAYRKGKSFFLNFLLRCLQHTTQAAKGDWLGDENAILTGFKWTNGCERDTEGVLMWRRPFVIKVPCGREVAVLLVDTQGVFDPNSTTMENTGIFSLSLLMSSLQIFNVQSNIGSDSLEYLQYFAAFARLVQEIDPMSATSQKLIFLVRDWPYCYECEYGFDGGEKLLNRVLRAAGDEHGELRRLKDGLRSCFSELQCLLLPHPGMRVAKEKDFRGLIGDMDKEFADCVRKFVPTLLAPDAIPVMKIGRETMKGKDLPKYVKDCLDALQSSELPEPRTWYQINVDFVLERIHQRARQCYELKMNQVCGSGKYLKEEQLAELHERSREEALRLFRDSRKMGDDEIVMRRYEALRKELDGLLEKYKDVNDSNWLLYPLAQLLRDAVAFPEWLPKAGVVAGSAFTAGGTATIVLGALAATGPVGIAVSAGLGGVAALTGGIVTALAAIRVHKRRSESRKKKDQ